MKIIIINNGMTSKISGGDLHILKVAYHWAEKHWITYLISNIGYNSVRNLLRGDVLICDSGIESSRPSILQGTFTLFIRTIKGIKKMKQSKYDIAIASSHFIYDLMPLFFFSKRNDTCITIAYYHGLLINEAKLHMRLARKINDLFAIVFLKRFDLIFAINSDVRKFLIDKGINQNKVFLTSNGIDISLNNKNDNIKKIYDGCYLGRIVRSKGIFDLVDIWKKVTEELEDARLVVIGDGEESEKLKRKILANSMIDKIILAGYRDHDRFDIMRKSKVFIFPSYSESWGIAIAEALSCGLPVVAFDIPIYHEIFNNNIITVPIGDNEKMPSIIIELLIDENLRRKIGEKGKKFVEKYNWKIIADNEMSTIDEMVKK